MNCFFFVNNKFDCLAGDIIRSTIADFFREDEILAAKQIVVQHMDTCQLDMIQPLLKKRIGENKVDRTIRRIEHLQCHRLNWDKGYTSRVLCGFTDKHSNCTRRLVRVKSDLAALKQQMNTLITSVARSTADRIELAAGAQTSSTQDIIQNGSSDSISGDISETISDQSVSYSAAVKSTNNSIQEANTDGFEKVRNKRHKRQKAKSITGCRPRSDTVSV